MSDCLLGKVFFAFVVGQYDVVNVEEDEYSVLVHATWLMWDTAEAKSLEGGGEVLLPE